MADFVLDASALLAIAFNEPGADIAISRMAACSVSAVNYSEASAKMIDKGFNPAEATGWLDALALDIAVLTYDKAMRERNRLLKDGERDRHWYHALEAQMADAGWLIHSGRLATLGFLTAAQARAETAFPVGR